MSVSIRWYTPILVVAALGSVTPGEGAAQVCAGLPSLRERPLVLGANHARSDAGWAAGGSVIWGRAAFVNLAAGYMRYQNLAFSASRHDAHSAVFHAGAGYEVSAQLSGRGGRRGTGIGVCPAAYVEYETGPDGDFGVILNSDALSVGIGASIGAVVIERGSTRVIPYLGLALVRAATAIRDFPFPGTDTRDTEYGGLLDLGIGIVLGRFTVGPEVTLPIGFSDADGSYGVGVSLSLGGGRR
jgi:hypothetical protein